MVLVVNKYFSYAIVLADLIPISPFKFRVRKTLQYTLTENWEIADQVMLQLAIDATATSFVKTSKIVNLSMSFWSEVDDAFAQDETGLGVQWSINNNINYVALLNSEYWVCGGIDAGTGSITFLNCVKPIPMPYYTISAIPAVNYPGYAVVAGCLLISMIMAAQILSGDVIVVELDLVVENDSETEYVDHTADFADIEQAIAVSD